MSRQMNDLLNRTHIVLAQEIEDLKDNDRSRIHENINEKVRLVAALCHLLALSEREWVSSLNAVQLKVLREKLDENKRLLSIQLRAASDVAEIVIHARRKAESPGVYNR